MRNRRSYQHVYSPYRSLYISCSISGMHLLKQRDQFPLDDQFPFSWDIVKRNLMWSKLVDTPKTGEESMIQKQKCTTFSNTYAPPFERNKKGWEQQQYTNNHKHIKKNKPSLFFCCPRWISHCISTKPSLSLLVSRRMTMLVVKTGFMFTIHVIWHARSSYVCAWLCICSDFHSKGMRAYIRMRACFCSDMQTHASSRDQWVKSGLSSTNHFSHIRCTIKKMFNKKTIKQGENPQQSSPTSIPAITHNE